MELQRSMIEISSFPLWLCLQPNETRSNARVRSYGPDMACVCSSPVGRSLGPVWLEQKEQLP